jgi:flagellar basal-body rod protein FlgG
MLKSLYTSATGMKAQQTFVDTISNNLANVNTTGFKRNTASFQDLLYVTMKQPGLESVGGRPNPMGLQLGSGSRLVGTPKIHTQGVLEGTNRRLDVAIQGQGFFKVTLPDGNYAYSRDGSFLTDAEGHLVTSNGYRLVPDITIPSDTLEVTITSEGQVIVTTAAAPETPTITGQLQLTRFINPSGLDSMGGNVFRQTPASGEEITNNPGVNGNGTLIQNFLERSNVEVVNELVNLIVAQRAYEVNSRAIRTSDEMLGQVNNIVR